MGDQRVRLHGHGLTMRAPLRDPSLEKLARGRHGSLNSLPVGGQVQRRDMGVIVPAKLWFTYRFEKD